MRKQIEKNERNLRKKLKNNSIVISKNTDENVVNFLQFFRNNYDWSFADT